MTDLRRITARLRGVQHGPISRLISPEGWGEQLKPFIFLDFFNANIEPGFGFAMHPHSGIATLTWQPGSVFNTRTPPARTACSRPAGWSG